MRGRLFVGAEKESGPGVMLPRRDGSSGRNRGRELFRSALQSFAGEYNLQVEFPREVGPVVQRNFAGFPQGAIVDVLCADG